MKISQKKYDTIVKQLAQFEQNKGYLSSCVSLKQLADDFETNYHYLSEIVNTYKGVNFSTYLNNLRVTYIYAELKNNALYQRYTVKAIAKEVGFRSTECFSKAFKRNFGIYPSAFLQSLDR